MGALSRILDDRGRLFGWVNIVDLVVVIVIVAVIVFAAVRLTGGENAQTVPVNVTFVARMVDRALVPGLQTKGKVTDVAGNVIGQVVSVEVTPTMEETVTADGQLKTYASTLHDDVTFVVAGQGSVFESTVHIGTVPARVGSAVKLFGPGYEIGTVITRVVSGAAAPQ
jgi:Domain of unknown function (DUF4330)